MFFLFPVLILIGELTSAIVSILQLNQFPISLESLARVEQDLLSQMSVSYFSLFHHGSFLEFIAKSDELLKCVGGRHIGESSVTSDFRRNRIFAFLNQLKQNFDDPKVSVYYVIRSDIMHF